MKLSVNLICFTAAIFWAHLRLSSGIETIHHDKPEAATIPKMASKMQPNITLTPTERQKRLLPYENFYISQNINQPYHQQHRYQFERPPAKNNYVPQYNEDQEILYQPQTKYTPFLESNALPGTFRPMLLQQQQQRVKVHYVPQQVQQDKVPNYSTIYDKLAQLKLGQQARQPNYYRIQKYHVPTRKPIYQYQPANYKTIQPSKTVVEMYTAHNIDIPTANAYQEPDSYPAVENHSNEEYEAPKQFFPTAQEYTQTAKPTYILVQPKQRPIQKPPIIIVQRKPIIAKPIVEDQPKYQQEYQPNVEYQPVQVQYVTTPKYEPYSTENSNNLGLILKQLQDTNTLPQTLTPENIDNSIKTLVKILGALRKQQKFGAKQPIIVPDEHINYVNNPEAENEADIPLPLPVPIPQPAPEVPGTTTQHFPDDTPDGGTPGKPGIDYPALSTIPPTSFNCKTQRYKGFFGDPDTNCQVWHYCDLNGGQASFLCPNGTIFSQVALTCDWWYNVKCSSTAQLYVLNERLYKYILPYAPKFPEDYSGPLVDKYLTLKFQEMEEKMRREKKGKGNGEKENESEEVDGESTESTSGSREEQQQEQEVSEKDAK